MTRKCHYTILGITRGESPEGIRAAYLGLVKSLHPDHAGESSAEAFREVQRAYDVLSDPEQRKSYDAQLFGKRAVGTRQPDQWTRRKTVEPLVPEVALVPRRSGGRWPLVDERTEPFFAGLTPIGSSDAAAPEVVDLDVHLSADQATRGGGFTIGIPVRRICSRCSGAGFDWPFPCLACGSSGWVAGEQLLHLDVPPRARHGTVVHLRHRQAAGVTVRVRLLVDQGTRAPPFR
jgi:DnaJ-class molecular chaperone